MLPQFGPYQPEIAGQAVSDSADVVVSFAVTAVSGSAGFGFSFCVCSVRVVPAGYLLGCGLSICLRFRVAPV